VDRRSATRNDRSAFCPDLVPFTGAICGLLGPVRPPFGTRPGPPRARSISPAGPACGRGGGGACGARTRHLPARYRRRPPPRSTPCEAPRAAPRAGPGRPSLCRPSCSRRSPSTTPHDHRHADRPFQWRRLSVSHPPPPWPGCALSRTPRRGAAFPRPAPPTVDPSAVSRTQCRDAALNSLSLDFIAFVARTVF